MRCAHSDPEIHQGHWAHPRTLLERVKGTPHLGTRESVLGQMRCLLQHSKRVREGLSNNNNIWVQHSKMDKTHALNCLKQLFEYLHMDNQITFLLSTQYPEIWQLPLTQVSAKESNASSITRKYSLRLDNHHEFHLLKNEPHVPLQTPGVHCCQILIQQFHHL